MQNQLSSSIWVQHNIEVAHRLLNLPGKCQQIHGHSMIVAMYLTGPLNQDGVLLGLDFGAVKKAFRTFLDSDYDHHLLLNEADPWTRQLRAIPEGISDDLHYQRLPGLTTTPGDPTTENLARWICEWAVSYIVEGLDLNVESIHIDIQETGTNGATAKWLSRKEP